MPDPGEREDFRRQIRPYRWTAGVFATILVAVVARSSVPTVTQKPLARGAVPTALDLVADARDPATLLSLGDAARLAGESETAKRAYVAIRSRYQSSVEQGAATFRLGDMERERHEYADAALWFDSYLRDHPGGPFSDEAEGRLMECLYRIGDQGGAMRVAAAYTRPRIPRAPMPDAHSRSSGATTRASEPVRALAAPSAAFAGRTTSSFHPRRARAYSVCMAVLLHLSDRICIWRRRTRTSVCFSTSWSRPSVERRTSPVTLGSRWSSRVMCSIPPRLAPAFESVALLSRYGGRLVTLSVTHRSLGSSRPFASETDLATGRVRSAPLEIGADDWRLAIRDCPPRTLLRIYWPLPARSGDGAAPP